MCVCVRAWRIAREKKIENTKSRVLVCSRLSTQCSECTECIGCPQCLALLYNFIYREWVESILSNVSRCSVHDVCNSVRHGRPGMSVCFLLADRNKPFTVSVDSCCFAAEVQFVWVYLLFENSKQSKQRERNRFIFTWHFHTQFNTNIYSSVNWCCSCCRCWLLFYLVFRTLSANCYLCFILAIFVCLFLSLEWP